MNQSDLTIGMSGGEIATLQEALQRLRFFIPASEIADTYFGPATRQAVARFQTQQRLPATGVVDSKTAAAVSAISPPPRVSDSVSNPAPSAATVAGASAPPRGLPAAPAPTFAPPRARGVAISHGFGSRVRRERQLGDPRLGIEGA